MNGTFLRRHRGRIAAIGIAVAAVTLACVGCVPGTSYRTQLRTTDYCVAEHQADCAHDVLHVVGGTPAGASTVLAGFVEFDDQGYLRRPELKDDLITHLDNLAQTRPLLVVVFAHGWKHNAAASDGNVQAFNRLLLKLAAADRNVCANQPCQQRQVVGIYLGWRGLSNRLEPFNTFSFWNRKSRAHRVGGDGAAEVLAELAKIKSKDRPEGIEKHSRMIVTGHSFGGALVYNAINQTLLRDTAFLNRDHRVNRTVADLVVLVNPAFEAARFHAIQRKAGEFEFAAGQRPIMAIFTSESDTATKRAFPIGRALATVFSEHRDAEQRRENIRAIGHYDPFRTHELLLTSDGESGPVELGAIACSWKDYRKGLSDHWQAGPVVLQRLSTSGAHRFNPYMVVRVADGIISGHSEIWGEQFADFLYRFVAVQTGDACPGPGAALPAEPAES